MDIATNKRQYQNNNQYQQFRGFARETFEELVSLSHKLKLQQELSELKSGERNPRKKIKSITAEFEDSDKFNQKQEGISDPSKRITLDIIESESMEELLMILSPRRDQLDCIHVTAAFGRLTLLQQDNRGTVVSGQEIYNFLMQKTKDLLMNFDARHISQVIRSVGRFRGRKEVDHLQLLCNTTLGLIDELDSSCFANILQGLSFVRFFKDPQFIRVMIDTMSPKLNTFSVLDLSVILNALSKFEVQELPEFFDKAAYEVQLQMRHLTAQGLTMLAMAYAKVGVYNQGLLDGITSNAIVKLRRLQPYNMTNLCCAYAKLNRGDKVLFEEIAKRAILKVDDFSILDIGKMIDAYTTVSLQNIHLCQEFSTKIVSKISECRTQEVSGLLYAFARARYYDQELLDAAEFFIKGSKDDFKGDEIVKAYYMYSLFDGVDVNIVIELSECLMPQIPSLNTHYLVNFVYCMGLVGNRNNDLLSSCLNALNNRYEKEENLLNDEDKRQLYLAMKIGGMDVQDQFSEELPQELMVECETCWKEYQINNRRVTDFHADVLAHLQKLLPEQEVLLNYNVDGDFLTGDFGFQYRNNDVLMVLSEADDYSVNEPFQRLRIAAIRQKYLEKKGHAVINVPYHVWHELQTPLDKQTYLEEKMRVLKRI